MQSNCRNIYKAARLAAGLTQERAAEMMSISVRSLADYESGVRVPHNDVVNQMVMCYNSQMLAIQHIRESTTTARELIPEICDMRLSEAVLTLIDAIYDFADDKMDRELIDIARDGVIDEAERVRFERIVAKLNTITAAAMAVRCARSEGQP
ncbi:MAG: helix-turn-helix domain-containing protein [Candidatus Enterenecus sp.]